MNSSVALTSTVAVYRASMRGLSAVRAQNPSAPPPFAGRRPPFTGKLGPGPAARRNLPHERRNDPARRGGWNGSDRREPAAQPERVVLGIDPDRPGRRVHDEADGHAGRRGFLGVVAGHLLRDGVRPRDRRPYGLGGDAGAPRRLVHGVHVRMGRPHLGKLVGTVAGRHRSRKRGAGAERGRRAAAAPPPGRRVMNERRMSRERLAWMAAVTALATSVAWLVAIDVAVLLTRHSERASRWFVIVKVIARAAWATMSGTWPLAAAAGIAAALLLLAVRAPRPTTLSEGARHARA